MAGCKVIAIYGGAGSGKSEVLRFMSNNYGAYVIKADELAHRLYRRGAPGYKAVIRICGKGILDESGMIDRSGLGDILFNDPVLLERVNNAIHPMVYAKARSMIEAYKTGHKRGIICFEAALLPGKKLDFIDECWYIRSEVSVRSRRMREIRHYSDFKTESVIISQPTDDEYVSHCDYIIENNQTLKELEEKVDEAVKHSQRQQR